MYAWVCIASFADHNTYVLRVDGARILKDRATLSDRIVGGALVGVPFATIITALFWAWCRLRQQRPALSNT